MIVGQNDQTLEIYQLLANSLSLEGKVEAMSEICSFEVVNLLFTVNMNKFSNDGSFMDLFKKASFRKSDNNPQCATANQTGTADAASVSSKNSLSRAFKQMSQLKEVTKPKLIVDEDEATANSQQQQEFAPRASEYNEYDATLPDSFDEPVTEKTYEVIDKLIESIIECGDDMERIIFEDQKSNPEFWFLHDKKSDTYRYFRKKLKETKSHAREKLNGMPTATISTITKDQDTKSSSSVPTISLDSLNPPVLAYTSNDCAIEASTDMLQSKWDDDCSNKSRKRKSRWGPELSPSVQLNAGNGQAAHFTAILLLSCVLHYSQRPLSFRKRNYAQ